MATKRRAIRVLMVPWLAHGHISPFLELAKKLSKRNIHIFLCSSAVNLSSIKIPQEYGPNIKLVELHIPSLPGLPPHYHTTKSLPPHLMPTLKKAFDMATPSLSKTIQDHNPDLLIYDYLLPWAPEVARSNGIPGIVFASASAATSSFVIHAIKKPPGTEYPFEAIQIHDYWRPVFAKQMAADSTSGMNDQERVIRCLEGSSEFVFLKSFMELEGKYIEYLDQLFAKKHVPVGPLVQDSILQEDERHILEWLDKKEQSSTVFVSFGTEYFLTKEEREEIAYGLELSNVNFIWAIKFPSEEEINLEEALPEEFTQRVGDRGLIVEGWAPQAKILEHPSTGGFISHCGWSSILESMKFGVPVVAMPMHLDQPFNARLVEDIGVGWEVRRNKSGVLQREEIAKVIRHVVVEESGENMRKKAKEISVGIRSKGDEEIDEVEDAIVKLCGV